MSGYEEIGVLLLAAVLGLLPAWIASRKGRNFLLWWVYGTLVFLVALVHALIITYSGPLVKCGYCGTMVRASSGYCPHCGYEFIDHG